MTTGSSDLPRLLETEARLRARRREAEAEASRLVAEAEAWARERRERVASERETLERRVRDEVAGEARGRIAALEREAEAVAIRYGGIPDETLDAWARDVARAVVHGKPLEEAS